MTVDTERTRPRSSEEASLPNRRTLKAWVKGRETPLARAAYSAAMWQRYASVPVIPGVHRALYSFHTFMVSFLSTVTRVLWFTPLFQSRLTRPARRLHLYTGMPYVTGPVTISVGEGCRIAGGIDINGRTNPTAKPVLTIGDNVDIGWDSSIAVGGRIDIGNNVRLAAGNYLMGYPGHPLDAEARARGEMETDDQVGDIVLEDDVWLGSRCTVSAGVRIGRGTIVAAGSVVTKDLPPFVLAAGVPAQIKKHLKETT